MTNIIKVESNIIENESVQTVNARELHVFLESKQDYSTWIKKRIDQYNFVENQDFIKLHKKMELSKTGQMSIEYFITLDMAKELSMVERNEKGKQARKYFIDCERKMKESALQLPDFTNPAEAAIAWANEYKAKEQALLEKREAEEKVKLAAPKVEFVDSYVEANGTKNLTEVAKLLDISPRKFIEMLIKEKFLYRMSGLNKTAVPYQKYIDNGMMVLKTDVINGELRNQTRITAKGIKMLAKKQREDKQKDLRYKLLGI